MSPLLSRIVAAMGAGALGQGVNIGMQLVSLPVFLHWWDLSQYGQWLMLSAMPAYLSMADVGMVSTAGNRMTMAMGRGDVAQANRVFHSATVFMALTCGALALLSTVIVLGVGLPGVTSGVDRGALLCLCLGVLVSFGGGLADAVFRATHRYALGNTLGTLVRLGEWAGSIVGLWLGRDVFAVALGGLLWRIAGTVVMAVWSRRGAMGLRWGLRDAHAGEVRGMVRPAMAFMLFPISNAITFQGLTLLTGHLLGPAMVAVFNTYRTLARVAVQITATLSHALWAEFSRLFGQGGAPAMAGLYTRAARLGVAGSLAFSGLLYVIGPTLLSWWTHGAVPQRAELLAWLLLYAAACGAWHVPRVALMATNRHDGLAQGVVLISVLGFGLSWVLAQTWQVEGVAAGMTLAELACALWCVLSLRKVMGGREAWA
jgi:O-antigen/teichoic acid export membrane protein